MYCKHCGKQVDDNAKFCRECGNSLNHAPYSNESTSTSQQSLCYTQVNSISDWHTWLYCTFGLWGISIILLFVDWFSFSFLGYSHKSNFFLILKFLTSTEYDEYYYVSLYGFEYLIATFIILLFFLAIIFGILSAFFASKNQYRAFTFGYITSHSLIFVGAIAIVVTAISSDITYTADNVKISNVLIDNLFSLTAAPYLFIIVSLISLVTVHIARKKFTCSNSK